jgi:hypothetical protein
MDLLSKDLDSRDCGGNKLSLRRWEDLVNSMQPVLIINTGSEGEATIERQNSIDAVTALGNVFVARNSVDRFAMRTEASSRVTKLLSESLHTKVDLDLRVVLSSALLAASQHVILTCKSSRGAFQKQRSLLTSR